MMRWPFRRADLVSRQWLRDLDRKGDRIEFHGVKIAFPIRKQLNESALMNTFRLRKRA